MSTRPFRRLVVALAVASVVLAACGSDDGDAADDLAGYVREPTPTVDGLVFVDHADGDPTEADLVAEPDGLLLAYFGYLSCPDVCPLTMGDIGDAIELLPAEDAARVETAFVTVDPARDTGEAIAGYLGVFLDRYRALLAPDDAALASAAEQLNVVYRIPEHEPGEYYEVDHSAVVYVIDDDGRVVREFPFGTTSEDMSTAIASVLRSDEAGV